MEKIKFKDLSGWLKFAFIYTLISAGLTAIVLILYMILGIVVLGY